MINILNSEKTKKIEAYFFSILLFELFIGGSGRVISFGFITLRMILFSIALIWFSIRLLVESKDNFIYRIITAFIALIIIGATVGYMNNAPKGLIFTDIKQLLFFLSIICFSICIKTKEQIDKIIKIIKLSTLILAVTYLICYMLIKLNIIEMDPFYNMLSAKWLHDEFMFRGTGGNFFYKGFFYLGIGIFFYLFSKPTLKNGLIAIVIYVALFLTLLRWLLAITLLVYAGALFYNWTLNKFKIAFLKSKEMIFHFTLISIMITIPIIFKNFYITALGNKQESVDIRKQQFNEVKSQILITESKTIKTKNSVLNTEKQKIKEKSDFNYFVGKGLGVGVPIRPVHMELTYLEIFFKQGILGLCFWLFILLYTIFNFRVNSKKHFNTSVPWITGVLVIYLQSITNPLLVNSIGMSFVIMALLILRIKPINKQEM